MDARKFPRIEVQLLGSFDAPPNVERGTVTNLSLWGCTVHNDVTLPEGTRLAFQITPPDEAEPIKIKLAIVPWSKENRFGLQFISLEEEDRERLRRIVQDFCLWSES